jgi:hypothetical protein
VAHSPPLRAGPRPRIRTRPRTPLQPSGEANWSCLSRFREGRFPRHSIQVVSGSLFVSTASGGIDERVPGCCAASSVSETLDWMPSGRSLLRCADRLWRTALPTPCTVRTTAHLGKLQNIVCLADHSNHCPLGSYYFDSLRVPVGSFRILAQQ